MRIFNSNFYFYIIYSLNFLIHDSKSECPNACTGHGSCEAFDACKCHKNWMANDCSESKI